MFFFENESTVSRDLVFESPKTEDILNSLWKNRYSFGLENFSKYKINKNSEQNFIKNTYKGLKVGHYTGVIQLENQKINIYPKIFKNHPHANDLNFSNYVFSHLLWWMTYSNKIRIPKTFSSYIDTNADFLEVLIYFFAYYTQNTLSNYTVNDYELSEDNLNLIKGRIKFDDYINNISKGQSHIIPCEYDEFQHDNIINRIILYVAKMLLTVSKNRESKKYLNEILFQLEYVSDQNITLNDCDKAKINPLYEEYEIIIDYCRMFLSNSIANPHNDSLNIFSFLINTANLYEDFLINFIEKHKDVLKIKKIKKMRDYIGINKKDNNKCFTVEIDYLIEMKDGRIIVGDAKYKKISNNRSEGNNNNYGISNNDVFQIISYASKKNSDEALLLYPSYSIDRDKNIKHNFTLLENNSNRKINLKVAALNIINYDMNIFKKNTNLNEKFKNTEVQLIEQINLLINE